jgi:Leucine-rich repeat (LRR) protein
MPRATAGNKKFQEVLARILNGESCTVISLARLGLDDIDVKNLMSAINGNPNVADTLLILDLSNNKLTVPPDLSKLKQLKKLDLGHNQLITAPDVSMLTRLEELSLPSNKLKIAPDVSNLLQLQRLYLYKNQLSVAPDVSALPELKRFLISTNQLVSPPRLYVHVGESEPCELSMGRNPLTIIGERLLKQMETMDQDFQYQHDPNQYITYVMMVEHFKAIVHGFKQSVDLDALLGAQRQYAIALFTERRCIDPSSDSISEFLSLPTQQEQLVSLLDQEYVRMRPILDKQRIENSDSSIDDDALRMYIDLLTQQFSALLMDKFFAVYKGLKAKNERPQDDRDTQPVVTLYKNYLDARPATIANQDHLETRPASIAYQNRGEKVVSTHRFKMH